jgi:hypothetical protein
MKRMNVILTDKQKKIIDQKFKELRILKQIEQEILNHNKKSNKKQ